MGRDTSTRDGGLFSSWTGVSVKFLQIPPPHPRPQLLPIPQLAEGLSFSCPTDHCCGKNPGFLSLTPQIPELSLF